MDVTTLSHGAVHSMVVALQLLFAASLADGSVVTWGRSQTGGDSSAVNHQLRNVREIHATGTILADGRVVAWGHPGKGGNNTAVKDELNNVQSIHATGGNFAAILADGSIVAWGDPDRGR